MGLWIGDRGGYKKSKHRGFDGWLANVIAHLQVVPVGAFAAAHVLTDVPADSDRVRAVGNASVTTYLDLTENLG
jgi:hypothetical protein